MGRNTACRPERDSCFADLHTPRTRTPESLYRAKRTRLSRLNTKHSGQRCSCVALTQQNYPCASLDRSSYRSFIAATHHRPRGSYDPSRGHPKPPLGPRGPHNPPFRFESDATFKELKTAPIATSLLFFKITGAPDNAQPINSRSHP